MNLTALQDELRQFAADRKGQPFQTPENLAMVQIADHCQVNLPQAVADKLVLNARKYPPAGVKAAPGAPPPPVGKLGAVGPPASPR